VKKTLILILLVSISNIFPQNKISISAFGGLNYIPMRDFSQYLRSFTNSDYNKVGFSGTLKFQYGVGSKHYFFLSSEFISTNASFSGGWVNVNWTFEAIPITLGYEYMFISAEMNWTPYLGAGVCYVMTTTEDKYTGDDGSSVERYSKNTFGFETKFGIEKKLIENLSVVSEFKYRFIGDTKLNKYTNVVETNLSGICLMLGLKLNVL
jgi:hypothetical protein